MYILYIFIVLDLQHHLSAYSHANFILAIGQTVHYVCILAKTKYDMQYQCTNKLIDFYTRTRHMVTLALATFQFQLLKQT